MCFCCTASVLCGSEASFGYSTASMLMLPVMLPSSMAGSRRGRQFRFNQSEAKPPMQKKTLIFIATLAVLLALAMALNPSPEKHRAAIKEAIAQRSPLAGALGVGALTAFVSSYHSVGVASYTVVNDRVATFGAFGMVFPVTHE